MAKPEDQILAALVELHPELDAPDALAPLDEGFGARLYATADGAIVRIPRTIEASQRMAVISTVAALSGLLPAPVPVPLWIEPATNRLPFGAMAYRRLDGIPLAPVAITGDLANDLARFLAALHVIAPGDADGDPTTIPTRDAIDAGRSEAMAVALPWLRRRVPATAHLEIETWWDGYQAFRATDPFVPAFIHGDFWYGNLLTDEDGTRLAGVLDWEHAAFDDPAQDYATLLHSGQHDADRVLAIACDLSGQDPESLRRRRTWHWGYREFSGLAMSIVAGDDAEAEESLVKLRHGALRHVFDPE